MQNKVKAPTTMCAAKALRKDPGFPRAVILKLLLEDKQQILKHIQGHRVAGEGIRGWNVLMQAEGIKGIKGQEQSQLFVGGTAGSWRRCLWTGGLWQDGKRPYLMVKEPSQEKTSWEAFKHQRFPVPSNYSDSRGVSQGPEMCT